MIPKETIKNKFYLLNLHDEGVGTIKPNLLKILILFVLNLNALKNDLIKK
jgi:hypothetical protein